MDTNTVVVATSNGGSKIVESIQVLAADYGMRVLGALAILIIGIWVARLIKKAIARLMAKAKVDPTLISFVASLSYIAMQVFVVLAALEKLNVKTTSFVAILGAAGLAVGLALQGSLSNFAAGVLMIIFKPFKVGDFIEAGGTTGSVQEIGIFTTVLNSPDNKKVIVPNSKVTADNIVNFTVNGTRRVDMTVGISYGDDIDKAKAAIKSVLAADARILKDPAPVVAVVAMADSSVNIVVRPWVKGSDYWDVYFGTTEAIKKKFDAEGITIPFPQRDVHIYEHK